MQSPVNSSAKIILSEDLNNLLQAMCTELYTNLKRKKKKKRLWYHCKPITVSDVSQLWPELLTKYISLTFKPVMTQCIHSFLPCPL